MTTTRASSRSLSVTSRAAIVSRATAKVAPRVGSFCRQLYVHPHNLERFAGPSAQVLQRSAQYENSLLSWPTIRLWLVVAVQSSPRSTVCQNDWALKERRSSG